MVELNVPKRRRCLRCGREEEFDESVHGWVVSSSAGETYCIHDWDINGTHNPIAE
ncbi:HEWD family protein [Halomicrococcus sp. SG-WS-1]|uniref:HEWD family protein n=1 Tax=Halomicrococcus sp. SG-WS-1 TaxID=3439057 RepID=UPI003F7AA803